MLPRGDFVAHLGPPRSWEFTDWGAPQWIATIPDALAGIWTMILPDVESADDDRGEASAAAFAGPAAMPSLHRLYRQPLRRPSSRGRGRPPLVEAKPGVSALAAWLTDMREWSDIAVAERPGLSAQDERTRRYGAKRYTAAGRRLLADHGVLPWVMWPEGTVPSTWWSMRAFQEGLSIWFDRIARPLAAGLAQDPSQDPSDGGGSPNSGR